MLELIILKAVYLDLDLVVLCISPLMLTKYYLHVGVTQPNYPGGTNSTIGADPYLSAYSWRDYPVYHSSVDPINYGQSIGILRRPSVGGDLSNSKYTGSRAVLCNKVPSLTTSTTDMLVQSGKQISTRGCNHALYYPNLSILPHSKSTVADYPYPNLFKL